MFQVGDQVIVMSASGHFTIVDIDGAVLTLENEAGLRKRVFVQAVRKRKEDPNAEC